MPEFESHRERFQDPRIPLHAQESLLHFQRNVRSAASTIQEIRETTPQEWQDAVTQIHRRHVIESVRNIRHISSEFEIPLE